MELRPRWCARATLLALLAAPLTVLVQAPTTAQAAVCNTSNHVRGDVNSDGVADLAVGVPFYDGGIGAVDLALSNGVRLFVQPQLYGQAASTPEHFFGHSVVLDDINSDGCDDLLVGAPGAGSGGKVYVFTSNGSSLAHSFTINSPTSGASFGSSLASFDNGNRLAIGAPDASPSGVAAAGAVYVGVFNSAGTSLGSMVALHQNSSGVPGANEVGDRFGRVLAATGRTVIVGAPEEAVGSRTAAGSVTFLTIGGPGTTLLRAKAVTQDTTGVPGTAESSDRCGAAVAAQDTWIAFGCPGESIGTDTRTGQVQPLLYFEDTAAITVRPAIHQDSPNIPGTNEDNDRFGSALAIGLRTHDQVTAIIGAPGEAVGSVGSAGAVTFVRLNASETSRTATSVTENSTGVPDVAQVGDRFGASVTIRPGDLDDGEGLIDAVAIGAPGENMGSQQDVGSVFISPDSNGPWNQLVFETSPSGMDLPDEAMFGSHLGSPGASAP